MSEINRSSAVFCDRKNCGACRSDGFCSALEDNNFCEKPCPFFKTKERWNEDEEKAYQRLLKLDRFDLIAKYELVKHRMKALDRREAEHASV